MNSKESYAIPDKYGYDTNAAGFRFTKNAAVLDSTVQDTHDLKIPVPGKKKEDSSSTEKDEQGNSVDLFDFAYNVGAGAIDNGLRIAIGGGNPYGAGAVMFSQVTTSSLIEGKEKGYSDEKAIKHGDDAARHAGRKPDEAMETIEKIDDVVEEVVEGGTDALSTPSSKVLRQNLIDAGVEVPDYPNAAHHIVAGSSPKAAEARAILQKYGVDINDAANGTFLPTVKDVAEGAYHPSLHTNAYYDKINKLLSEATCKEDVLDILEFIGDELSSGTFMQ